MTSPSRLPTRSSTARPRRVKRGIVAGYIHDISPRHRASAETVKPISVPVPTSAAAIPAPALVALEPQQA